MRVFVRVCVRARARVDTGAHVCRHVAMLIVLVYIHERGSYQSELCMNVLISASEYHRVRILTGVVGSRSNGI